MTSRRSTTREDWCEAGLRALARGGVAAIAVEPLAQTLGVTKGSFYWHFRDRDALVDAVLELWERRAADDVIEALLRLADPRERVRRLFSIAWGDADHLAVEKAVLAAAVDPDRSRVVARVHEKRRAFLVCCYRELDRTPRAAEHWAATAYATYLGAVQLAGSPPFSDDRARAAWVKHVEGVLLPAVEPTRR